jgi:hypothetical protein
LTRGLTPRQAAPAPEPTPAGSLPRGGRAAEARAAGGGTAPEGAAEGGAEDEAGGAGGAAGKGEAVATGQNWSNKIQEGKVEDASPGGAAPLAPAAGQRGRKMDHEWNEVRCPWSHCYF